MVVGGLEEEDEGGGVDDDGRFASLNEEELVLWNFEFELAGIWVLTGGAIVVATVLSFGELPVVGLVERNNSSMIESVFERSGSICSKLKSVPKSKE